jgi:ABC-type antimicrobial peptide transport system permease subunit
MQKDFLLFGLGTADPAAIAIAAALLAAVAILVGILSARRASQVDPMVALC